MGFFKNILNSLVRVSLPLCTFENNTLKFRVNDNDVYIYALEEYDIKTRHDPYVQEAYTLKNAQIHFEFIRTDEDISWNGLSRSFYESLLQKELQCKHFELMNREEIGHYEFSTYLIDHRYTVHLIYIWEMQKEMFIVDTCGHLYHTLLNKMQDGLETKKYNYETIKLDVSLVKNNAFHGYFNQSSS
jgi:hypothetical protein